MNTIFDFFKRKVSNDLEVNTSGATLLSTNVEENSDVPIEENPDEPVEENLNVPIEENSQTKFQKVDMSSLQLELDLDCVEKYILIMLINEMRSSDVTSSWIHTSLVLKNFKNLRMVEAFKVLGMKMFALSHGLNILLKKMPFFVYHAFSFIS